MYKIKFLFFFLFLFTTICFSQTNNDNESRLKRGEDLNVMYRNEGSFGVFVHSAGGIGLAYRRGIHVTAKRKRMFELEAQNFKHPKEVRTVSGIRDNSKTYYYGKLNSFFLLRPGIGYQNILYQKSDKKSVEIRYSYFIGGIINFAKPVYLEIKRDPAELNSSIERYDPEQHNQSNIYGKAKFYYGFDHLKIYPGGYAKVAVSFEYANRYNRIKAIETGLIADVYPQVIPMMAFNKNQQVFAELYLKMIWGKKWF